MRSSIYINERGPNIVSLDFSASPSELIDKESMNGFAFQKTLEHLGLEATVNSDAAMWSRLDVTGSVETIRQRIPVLQKHIGLIARYSADRSKNLWPQHERKNIGSILGKLVQRDLPELPEDASILRAIGLIVEPFADKTNNDGVVVYYARRKARTSYESDPSATAANGTPLGQFEVRDIGGFEIGWDGLRAKSQIRVKAVVPEDELYEFQLISRLKDVGTAENLATGVHRLIDQGADIGDRQEPTREEKYANISVSLPRTLLQRMQQDLPDGLKSGNDAIVSAIKAEVAAARADPEIQAKIHETKERWRQLYGGLVSEEDK